MNIKNSSKHLKMLKLHHLGYATDNINSHLKYFLKFSVIEECEYTFDDVEQNVRVKFVLLPNDIRVELIETLDSKKYSPLSRFIKNNVSGFHHLCFESPDINQSILAMADENFRLISKSDNGFEGRKIRFFLPKGNPDGPLIEIVSEKLASTELI